MPGLALRAYGLLADLRQQWPTRMQQPSCAREPYTAVLWHGDEMAQACDRARWAQVDRERTRRGADQHANWSWGNAPRGGELQDRQSAQQPHLRTISSIYPGHPLRWFVII